MPDAESSRGQIDRIVASREFSGSERMIRFLRLTARYALDGRSGDLKEYVIGTEVYDRPASYDPRVDPIVRVEARRLRAKLRAYYEGDGKSDAVIADLPKGAYALTFQERGGDPGTAPVAGERSIAVLPFANLTSDLQNEYFSDGLTEELIQRLTRVEGLRVVAWTSALRFKQPAEDMTRIARELGVEFLLLGSVREAGGTLRVTARLVDTQSSAYRWSQSYDRPMRDVFVVQDEISSAIASRLEVQLVDRPAPVRTYNLEAYNLYLQGRFHWNRRSTNEMELGLAFFERAIAADPRFALAHAGLADGYSILSEYGLADSAVAIPKARAAAMLALDLDPTLGEAHCSLAMIRSHYDWDWPAAERHYLRSLDLNPGYATAHHWYSVDYLGLLGRFDDAMSEIEIAIHLDPLSAILREGKAHLLMLQRRYAEAEAAYRDVILSDPGFFKAHASLGRALSLQGRFGEALEALLKGHELSGYVPSVLAAIGHVHALAGDADAARGFLKRLESMSRERAVPAVSLAIVHVGLGENDRALDLLEAACERRDLPLVSLGVHPIYDPLRGHPRFEAILQRIGLRQ